MEIKNWRYYNHAAIPTTPINSDPDLTPVNDNSIWNLGEKSPLLVRWTTDFDCDYKTNWWFVIKYAPFQFDLLEAKARKHIRQALKKNDVKIINPEEYAEELCEVYNKACASYKGYSGTCLTKKDFTKNITDDYFASFNKENGKLIGYMKCRRFGDYVETVVSKYDPEYLNRRASDAIHYAVLDYYLNQNNYKFVSSGSRSIEHITNVQDYKISTFGFKKAYCKLHIKYNPKIKWLIKILYPFRNIIGKFKNISVLSKVYSLLKMEELKWDKG